MKFDKHRKAPNKLMKQYLRDMSNMIIKLKLAGHNLTDEQQVHVIIRSLSKSWEHLKINMIHNESIKTFVDISRCIKLEDKHFEVARPDAHTYIAKSSSKNFYAFKRKWNKSKKGKEIVQGSHNKNKQFEQRKINVLERETKIR